MSEAENPALHPAVFRTPDEQAANTWDAAYADQGENSGPRKNDVKLTVVATTTKADRKRMEMLSIT
jgi:hypothetical protein